MPHEPDALSDELIAVLVRVATAAREVGFRPVVFGGIAANLRGRRRYTDDVDLAIDAPEGGYEVLLERLRAAGVSLPPTALERLRRDGMLGLWLGDTKVDILVPAEELTREVIDGAPDEEAFGIKLGVARPEHLIVMKLIPRRPQDLLDIQAILVRNRGALDFGIIERWLPEIEQFSPGATELFRQQKAEFHDPPPAKP